MEFEEDAISAGGNGRLGDDGHAVASPAGGRAARARVGAWKLDSMGRVDGDGAAELLHLGNAEHVDDEIVVAKAGAALAQDYADICSFTDLGDDVLCIPRCDELGFLDLDDPSRCGSGLGGGDNQISLAAQESRDLDDVSDLCDGFGLLPAMLKQQPATSATASA